MLHDELTAAWADWQNATLYRKWARTNPGEAVKLDAYRAFGDPANPPVLATATGQALLHETTAWLLGKPTVPPPSGDWLDPPAWPAFTPVRLVNVATRQQFDAAYNDLRPGDRLVAAGIRFYGQVPLHKRLTGWAEIVFNECVFLGDPNIDQLNGAWVKASYHRVRGGEFTVARGTGIRFEDCDHITWHHANIHDCMTGGLFVTSISRDNIALDVHARITRGGTSTKYDNHAEKGTGIHGAYIGGRWQEIHTTRDSVFRLDVDDQPYGAAVEVGEQCRDSVFYVRAKDVTFQAQSQVAGNALQLFGDLHNVTIARVEGTNLAGRVVETGVGLYPSSSGVVVEHGRGTNTNLNPLLDDERYAPHPAVTYRDCT